MIWDVVVKSPLKYTRNTDRSITAKVDIVQIGNARLLTIPRESMPNIGFFLKQELGAENNLLFGLTNDAFRYILTEVDFDSFARYDYVSRTSLGDQSGEIMIDPSLKLIPQLDRATARRASRGR